MLTIIKQILANHKKLWKDNQFLVRILIHAIFLSISVILTYVAITYTDGYAVGNVVPDIFLDHIPKQDVGLIFFQGSFVFIASLLGLAILLPEAIPFGLASTALFFLVRAGFMTMTHLSAPFIAHYSYISYREHVPEIVFSMNSGNDLFFSGHTGFPFMLAIMFWQHKYLKYYFLLCSIIAGIAVIAGHLHYSIDVFSAFFIGYGIFVLAKSFFKKEYEYFENRPKAEISVSLIVKKS
jgi:PAP2 superfamily C-terminal